MKRGLVPLFLAVLAPAVLAQDQGIFGNAFSLIFGTVSGSPANDMVLKVGLWLALTMVLFQGAQKIFKTKDANGFEVGHKKLSIMFALIISTIAVRFMPPFISEGLGAMTWIAALILLPYTLVSFVTDNKWARIIATAIFVILTWALFSSYSAPFVFPYIRGNNFLSDLFYMMTPQAWMIPVIAIGSILILFFIFSAKGAPSPGGGGSSKGGFWDYMAGRKAAKAGIKQEKIQAGAQKEQAKQQARALERQAIERRKAEEAHARAAVEKERIQARAAQQPAQRKPGLMKNLFKKFATGAIKNLTTPKSPQVKIAEIQAQAAREKAEREKLAAQAPTPKSQLSRLERWRRARAARRMQQPAKVQETAKQTPLQDLRVPVVEQQRKIRPQVRMFPGRFKETSINQQVQEHIQTVPQEPTIKPKPQPRSPLEPSPIKLGFPLRSIFGPKKASQTIPKKDVVVVSSGTKLIELKGAERRRALNAGKTKRVLGAGKIKPRIIPISHRLPPRRS